jgi:Putative porin
MKRFWMLALLMAGSLAVLTAPALAKASSDDNSADTSSDTSLDDVNSALGSMAVKLNEMSDKMKDELSFYGDMRARYVFIAQGDSNPGTVADQSFARYRARLGAMIHRGDFDAKFRIATGSTNQPWSQNNTWDLGMVDPTMNIDTAEIDWTPSFADKMLTVSVGKMGNPLTKTVITWDPDIQPEGVYVGFKKNDFSLKATYFELGNEITSLIPSQGKVDLFMDNLQAEYDAKLDGDSGLDLMVGYEYIPNSTLISTALASQLSGGAMQMNVQDTGGVYRDWNNVEAMLAFKTKAGDVPLKFYVHATDNLNGKNLPDPNSSTGYSSKFTNQYAWLAGVDIGKAGEGSFGGQIFYAQTDPNAQLGYLVDDDSGRTNTSYLAGTLATDLAKGVQLKLSSWVMGKEYYGILAPGTNQAPQFRNYLDCIVNL